MDGKKAVCEKRLWKTRAKHKKTLENRQREGKSARPDVENPVGNVEKGTRRKRITSLINLHKNEYAAGKTEPAGRRGEGASLGGKKASDGERRRAR